MGKPGEDHDRLSIKLSALKQIIHNFNLSISSGIVPKIWKKAQVIPLYKGSDKNNLNNYRPIFKIPCLVKILEYLINNHFKTFLSSASILSPLQSGFRAGHSTVSAVSLVINNIVSALDDRKHCAALLIDLSKAFDTVDHSSLLQRLHDIGFDHSACTWFGDYLSDKQQSVKLGSYQSEFLSHKWCPPGLNLGSSSIHNLYQ